MKQKAYLTLLVFFLGLVFASSTTVVTQKQLAAGVHAATGASADSFLSSWKAVWWIFVKGWHATEFGLIYFLGRRSGMKVRDAAVVGGFYAIFDEFHQNLVPARGARISDIFIDWLGIAMAWYWIDWRTSAQRSPKREVGILVAAILILALFSFFPFGSLESLDPR